MQTMQSKHSGKKEPFPEKIKPASFKPSAHRRVAFFRRCGLVADFVCCSPMQPGKRKR
ncbi:hypothetical protein HNQ56_003931 [Anaerotaenia torta]|uniref:hypothetical protein n=1 Tax=Anaerotaenia torta TaxID=433293 RepID=UPI003D24961B